MYFNLFMSVLKFFLFYSKVTLTFGSEHECLQRNFTLLTVMEGDDVYLKCTNGEDDDVYRVNSVREILGWSLTPWFSVINVSKEDYIL